MSNHAYESAAALWPSSNGPISISTLCERFSLAPASAEGAAIPNNLSILGVSVDSADTVPSEPSMGLFGFTVYGTRFVADVVAFGTVAVLTDADGVQIAHQTIPGISVLVYSDLRAVVGPLSAEVYHHPVCGLATTAVTGTNGETTIAYFLDAILSTHVGGCTVAGTVELRVGERSAESPCITVETPVLQRMVAPTVENRVGAAFLGASSHTIILRRLDGIVVDIAGFINPQHDHLDFHKTMEGYLEAKAQLLAPEHVRRGVVRVDDQWGAALAAEVLIETDRVRTYLGETPADWWVSDATVPLADSATTFTPRGPDGEKIKASCPLPGLVNAQNAALALVMAIRVGASAVTTVMVLAGVHNIPGRMQRISQRGGRRSLCIVDFTHTPNAMELALKAVCPTTPGHLIVVLGSDGDRDQGKRSMPGEVCVRPADVLVVTDGNPRSKDPQLTCNAIPEGVCGVCPDLMDVEETTTWRGDAVRRGVELCGPDDIVIVTGKGHEPFLEMAGEFIRYNDAPVMAEAVEEKWGRI